MNRRDAVKLAAVGAAVAGAGTTLAQAQEEKKTERYKDEAAKRFEGHKTASREELEGLERKTEPFQVRVGIDPPDRERAREVDREVLERLKADYAPLGVQPMETAWASPRPDLNGLRVKLPNRPEIYLIDRGYRRWIPNPATYNNLFRDWNGIVTDISITDIPLSTQITSGAVLARGDGTAPVYLIDNGVKRWVTSPAAMDKYYFAWNRVYVVPPVLVNFIPNGASIS
jgi:hypothetical protein